MEGSAQDGSSQGSKCELHQQLGASPSQVHPSRAANTHKAATRQQQQQQSSKAAAAAADRADRAAAVVARFNMRKVHAAENKRIVCLSTPTGQIFPEQQ